MSGNVGRKSIDDLRGQSVTSGEYEDAAGQALRDIQRQMAELPVVQAAMDAQYPPAVWLKCAKGHRVLQVTMNPDHNWNPFVGPVVEDSIPAAQKVARDAMPGRRSGGVCSVSGCPDLVPAGVDTCEDHGAMVTDELGGLRPSFTCPTCTRKSKDGEPRPIPLRQGSLLKRYVAALTEGRKWVRIDGSFDGR